jgi:DNA modification methylase
MVAFALRADGWYLRQDIIWHKPNVMPESVKDRPTKAHEYIFLLSKSSKYYYDAEAIKEPLAKPEELLRKTPAVFGGRNKHDGYGTKKYSGNKYVGTYTGRNKRSVWTIPTKPFKEAHFAVFPPDLIKPCILAGTSPHACEICGAPWERVVERISLNKQNIGGKLADIKKTGFRNDGNIRMGYAATKTLGWQPTCTCQNEGKGRCIVLDPFMGSGTTALVAKRLNRNYIGIDINPEYCKMAQERLQGITYKDKQLMEQGQLTLELKI